jgi:hypothetical protein
MNALYLLVLEIIFLSGVILFLHKLRHFLGIGILLVFLGTVQFYQTVLASSVYNEIFKGIIVSPGSAILFTSTLFCILLLFHSEGVKKTRTAIFGILFSNVVLSMLSLITLFQLEIDNHSIYQEYLGQILNFDITLFLIGTCLLLFDLFLIIIIYQFLNLHLKRLPLFFKLYIPLGIVAFFDSFMFYSINFFSLDANLNLLYSNVIGKQIATFIFTLSLFGYLKLLKLETPKEKPNNLNDVIAVFTFDDTNAK